MELNNMTLYSKKLTAFYLTDGIECFSSFSYSYTHMNVLKLAQNSGYFHGSMSSSSIQGVAEDEVASGVSTQSDRSRKGKTDKNENLKL
jgi:hypothetical protein